MTVNNISVSSMLIILSLLGGLFACDNNVPVPVPQYSDTPKKNLSQVYFIAVHPLHNPSKLLAAYQPLINYLNKKIPSARFELEASRNYQSYESKIRKRKPAFLLPNPWQSLRAMEVGYNVIAEAGDSDDFSGLFIVRTDSKLQSPEELRGEKVSYPSPTALAACIMPQYFLYQHKIDVQNQIENLFVGSQESAIMSAFLQQSAVGVSWGPAWRLFQKDYPDIAEHLRVIWTTKPLINNSFMVRNDVDVTVAKHVQQILLGLHATEEGRSVLNKMETARFNPADNVSYEVVRQFIDRFERDVRPVKSL